MKTRWTSHLKSEEEIKEFQDYIRASKRLLDRMKDILEEEKTSLDRSEISNKVYDNPNWAYLQAHKNGYRQCLGIINSLIDLDQELHNERNAAGQQQPRYRRSE